MWPSANQSIDGVWLLAFGQRSAHSQTKPTGAPREARRPTKRVGVRWASQRGASQSDAPLIAFSEINAFFATCHPCSASPNVPLRSNAARVPYFALCAQDASVLYHIKKQLGFGRVAPPPRSGGPGRRAWCLAMRGTYFIADRISILRLIHLFNGRLLLKRSNLSFARWLRMYNYAYSTHIL